MAERKTERFPDFHLPHPDLKILRNPRFLSILGLFVVTGGYVGIKQYQDYLNELNKRPAPRSQTIDTPPSFAPAVVPIDAATATATRAPSPTATETQVPPTATSTATEVPASPTTAPTTAPTKTPTKEAEKPILPEYGIFTGRLIDLKAKKAIGSILISQLPKPVNQILVYYVAQRQGRPFLITSLKPVSEGSTVFQNTESRYERILIDASKPNQIIGGLDYSDGSRQMIFTIPLDGDGKRSFMDTYKEIQIREYDYRNAVISDERVIKELAEKGIILP